jgi:hypothetical protein
MAKTGLAPIDEKRLSSYYSITSKIVDYLIRGNSKYNVKNNIYSLDKQLLSFNVMLSKEQGGNTKSDREVQTLRFLEGRNYAYTAISLISMYF